MKTTRIDSDGASGAISITGEWWTVEGPPAVCPYCEQPKCFNCLGREVDWATEYQSKPPPPPTEHQGVKVGTRWRHKNGFYNAVGYDPLGYVELIRPDCMQYVSGDGRVTPLLTYTTQYCLDLEAKGTWTRLPDPEGWRERCKVVRRDCGAYPRPWDVMSYDDVVCLMPSGKWFRQGSATIGAFRTESAARLALANCPTPPPGEKETECPTGSPPSAEPSGSSCSPPSSDSSSFPSSSTSSAAAPAHECPRHHYYLADESCTCPAPATKDTSCASPGTQPSSSSRLASTYGHGETTSSLGSSSTGPATWPATSPSIGTSESGLRPSEVIGENVVIRISKKTETGEASLYLPLEARMKLSGCWPKDRGELSFEHQPYGFAWMLVTRHIIPIDKDDALNALSRGLEDWLMRRNCSLHFWDDQYKVRMPNLQTGRPKDEDKLYTWTPNFANAHEALCAAGDALLPKEPAHE